ncbi:WD repeat-containing protein 55 [Toxocara canis]|uniref:WD repeat-containing protein 55 n=1 Tax=Toxocara canis TaxID=6265 RepID=A0A0B2UY92_TOXCA|nr:WD repeat-containing protein 55 [Toxocara canis]
MVRCAHGSDADANANEVSVLRLDVVTVFISAGSRVDGVKAATVLQACKRAREAQKHSRTNSAKAFEQLCVAAVVAARKLKSAVRHIEFSLTGEHLYSVSANKALCVYDVESNKRIRCIRKSHDDLPNVLCILPLSSTKGQQIATGDESGQLRTWDMRVAHPQICSFDDLEGIVNHLEISGNTLLAACSDGTLGAYELRQRKLIVRSEPMSSELLSIAPADSFTYVGNGDGYIEVFKKDQYGNILERIETPHSMGVDCVRLLRGDLLLTASTSNADLRLVHVNPNKCIGSIGTHKGGVQQFAVTGDRFWLISVGWLKSTLKFWNVPHILDKIPILRADVLSKWKGKSLTPNFFADLLSEQNEENSSDGTDDDSDGDEQSSEDEDMEESGESNEQVLHKDAVPMQEQQSSDDESMEQIDGSEEGKSQKAL